MSTPATTTQMARQVHATFHADGKITFRNALDLAVFRHHCNRQATGDLKRMQQALELARACIAEDRQALLSCHGLPPAYDTIPASDSAGTNALQVYDDALAAIDNAGTGMDHADLAAPRDISGEIKPQATLVEQQVVQVLNTIKATPVFEQLPEQVRMMTDAVLMMAEQRRTGLTP